MKHTPTAPTYETASTAVKNEARARTLRRALDFASKEKQPPPIADAPPTANPDRRIKTRPTRDHVDKFLADIEKNI